MGRAPRILWEAAGRPDPRKPMHEADDGCYWCGSSIGGNTDMAGCRVKDVCGSTFTDHDCALLPTSPWVCAACAWAMTGRPPDTLRLWSIVYREDRPAAPSHPKARNIGEHLHLCNKADLSEVESILRAPPAGRWVCSVADSGQIHVAPHAVVNRGAGAWRVRFERFDISATPAEYAVIADTQQRLYDLGYSKDDIAGGAPYPSRLAKLGIATWLDADAILSPYRGGPLFALALFLRRRSHDRDRADGASRSTRARDDAQREHGQDPSGGLVGARENGAGDGCGQLGLVLRDGGGDGA